METIKILPGLRIKDFYLDYCLLQGGMGKGVSRFSLSGNVSKDGGLGIISSVGIRDLVYFSCGKKVDIYEATQFEIERAQDISGGRPIGINIMCALNDYPETVKASIDAGYSAIFAGAGLPLDLPGIKPPGHTALIPIISSARALEIIVKRWEKYQYRPDAVVLEGPRAGGHLGFNIKDVYDPEFALEKLLPRVLEVAHKYGDFPVIAAGGIFTHEDILKFLEMGASGVQMGTRFLATQESSATEAYKQAVVDATEDDILVVSYPTSIPASPCGLPFRILTTSPMYTAKRTPKCTKGYILRDGHCKAKESNDFLCACVGLSSSAGDDITGPALYTVGSNAHRVKDIPYVNKLMGELCRGE